jgi:hypothetical protein
VFFQWIRKQITCWVVAVKHRVKKLSSPTDSCLTGQF